VTTIVSSFEQDFTERNLIGRLSIAFKRAATLATGKIAIHSQAPIGAEQARDGASVDWQKTLNPGIW
jgi:hypothetical protein